MILIVFMFITLWLFSAVVLKSMPNLHIAFIYTLFSVICPILIFSTVIYLRKHFFINKGLKISYLEFSLCAYYNDREVDSWKVYVYVPTVNVFIIDRKSGNVSHLESFLDHNQYLYFTKKISSKIFFVKEKFFTEFISVKTYYDYSELPVEVAILIKVLKAFIEEAVINPNVQNNFIITPHLYFVKIEQISMHYMQ